MEEKYKVAVLTISDSASKGERIDTSGPKIKELLIQNDYEVVYDAISSDDKEDIKYNILRCIETEKVDLVITTGGTGFSIRDNTPEVTKEIVEKEIPGIPELMRLKSLEITDKACLSRSACGIKGKTIILNLPGSEKAAKENLLAVIKPLKHGLLMLKGNGSARCGENKAVIEAVCISEKRGIQKHQVDSIELKVDHGIVGDAHAGNWHRQVSILSSTSVKKVQDKIPFTLNPGAFAENILIGDGICLYELPIGTKMNIGTSICEVTQIGKECHESCEIRKIAGDCVMPREGIFVKVLKDGIVKKGDYISLL